jgi:hypothetical protein
MTLGGKMNDTAEAAPMLVSTIFEIQRGGEISVRVDEDLDENGGKPMGFARFVLDASRGARDLDLPIVLDGVVTGAVSLRVEDVPAP